MNSIQKCNLLAHYIFVAALCQPEVKANAGNCASKTVSYIIIDDAVCFDCTKTDIEHRRVCKIEGDS